MPQPSTFYRAWIWLEWRRWGMVNNFEERARGPIVFM
jgi:hypothetical protein